MVTIDGLNTGLDTEAIINGLLDIQKTQIDRLTARRQTVATRQAAFRSVEAHLIQFRTDAARLARLQNSVFDARSVNVSNPDSLLATASAGSAAGTYQLTVLSLAQAHQVASQSLDDADAEITQGTLTIRRGSSPPVNVTVDDSNDTLQGLADSINLSSFGVTASVVTDGSGGSSSARLLLVSDETGTANAMTITNNLAASGGGAVRPLFDTDNPVQAATDATVRLGNGSGAIVVSGSENRIRNAIPGLTLDLLEAEPTRTVTLKVSQDAETTVSAVKDFVDSYNALTNYIADQTRYNAESGQAGVLLGERSLIQIQSQIQNSLQTVVPGLNPLANRLSTLGISVTDKGLLTLNESRLTQVLNGEISGVRASDVKRFFTMSGVSTNSGIEFVLGSTRTRATTDPIEVDVSRAAERAGVTATSALAGSTVIASGSDQVALTIDGQEITVTLSTGTYTSQQLADHLETAINSHPDVRGRSVAVGLVTVGADTKLTLTSESYGGTSQVTVRSGTAMTLLGFNGTENDQGLDVQGRFLVDGVEEVATGSGRLLSGKSTNANTADLQVRVTLNAAQVLNGVESELTISAGLASELDRVSERLLNAESGLLKSVDDRFQTSINNVQASIDRQQEAFDKQQQELVEQFVQLERAMGELENTRSFLTQQFSSLSSLRTGSRR